MKVLIASDLFWPKVDGVATFSRTLAQGLADRGHEVMVIAPSTERRTFTESDGNFKIHRIWSVTFPLYPIRFCPTPRGEIKNVFDSFKPDIAHIQSPLEIGRNTLLEARKRKIPVVATNHGMPENLLDNLKLLLPLNYPVDKVIRIYATQFHNKADFVTMPTQSAIDELRGRFSKDYTPVSNGVDTKRFSPGKANAKIAKKYGVPTGKPVILFVGRLDAEKHLNVWLDGLKLVLEKSDVHGLIVGRGTVQAQLEHQAAQIGIAAKVSFTGFVPDEDLPELYKLGTIFAITSPAELQSIAALEATASGLPLVAANAVALPEICRSGINGLLFEPENPEAMANSIDALLSDPSLLASMKTASRTIALEHSFDRTLDTFENIYGELITKAAIHHS